MWKDILKISTEDAISDAKRFAGDEIKEGNKGQILDVWRNMGFQMYETETARGEPSILIQAKGKEPEGMFNRFFDFLEAVIEEDGFYVIVPNIETIPNSIHSSMEDTLESKIIRDNFMVKTPNDAKKVGELYLKRYNKAVATYKEGY